MKYLKSMIMSGGMREGMGTIRFVLNYIGIPTINHMMYDMS